MTKVKILTRRERNLADIRDRATTIAERIVLEEGVDALNARRLAKELDVSVGSLYNAFGDLDAVVRAVIAKSMVMLSEILHSAIETSAQDKRSRVVALGEAYFDFVNGILTSWVGLLVMFGSLWALWFHFLGGLRHLVMDFGYGYELKAVDFWGWTIVALSFVLTAVSIYCLVVN